MIMNREMLCQDCLRVLPFDQAGHDEDYFCRCGGQWCGCKGCQETIARLRAGEWRGSMLGLTVDLRDWSEKDGAKPAETSQW